MALSKKIQKLDFWRKNSKIVAYPTKKIWRENEIFKLCETRDLFSTIHVITEEIPIAKNRKISTQN